MPIQKGGIIAKLRKIAPLIISVFVIGFIGEKAYAQNFDTRADNLFSRGITSDAPASPFLRDKSNQLLTTESAGESKKLSAYLSASASHKFTTNAFVSNDNRDSDNIFTGALVAGGSYKLDSVTSLSFKGSVSSARYADNEDLDFDFARATLAIARQIDTLTISASYQPGIILVDDYQDKVMNFHDFTLGAGFDAMPLSGPGCADGKSCWNVEPAFSVTRRFAAPDAPFTRTGLNGILEISGPMGSTEIGDLSLKIIPAAEYLVYDDFPDEDRRDLKVSIGAAIVLAPQPCSSSSTAVGCIELSLGVAAEQKFSTRDANDYDAFTVSPMIKATLKW